MTFPYIAIPQAQYPLLHFPSRVRNTITVLRSFGRYTHLIFLTEFLSLILYHPINSCSSLIFSPHFLNVASISDSKVNGIPRFSSTEHAYTKFIHCFITSGTHLSCSLRRYHFRIHNYYGQFLHLGGHNLVI